jgi:AraC family transcriptional regulator of adaptative response/methylated-DNA-[protein]-cysteine methyltransferase
MIDAPFYGVTTTGIFCRRGCASRAPLPKNVRRFNDVQAARSAGFRACKRCRPDDAAAIDERIVQACRVLDDADERVTLEQLARRVALSPAYLQRLFTRTMGISPRAYGKFARDERFARPRGGGKGTRVSYAIVPSPLGRVLVAATSRGICRVDIDANDAVLERRLRQALPSARFERSDDRLESATSRIVAYLANAGPWPLLPLDVRATAFQLRVWEALRSIKPGRTMRYAELAHAIGSPSAARAVAQACANNPVALLIPCHRVVPAAGGVGGYRWGSRRKQRLLEIERVS